MAPISSATAVVKELIPPELKQLAPTTLWRLWMAGGLTVTALGSAIHVALACGYFPFYAGFAGANDLSKVKEEVSVQVAVMEKRVMARIDAQAETLKAQRVNTLRKDLFDARQKQCKAPSGTVRTMMTEQISNMQTEYRALAGESYPLPGCSDF